MLVVGNSSSYRTTVCFRLKFCGVRLIWASRCERDAVRGTGTNPFQFVVVAKYFLKVSVNTVVV